MVHPAVAVQSAYSMMGGTACPSDTLHCQAGVALLIPCKGSSLHQMLGISRSLWQSELVSTSLFLGQIVRCCWASQRAFFRPILSSCLTFASVCFTFETVALSKLLLASIMQSGPKHAAWLAHYTWLTCWPDQDPLCVLLLPEAVHSLVEDNKEYWHWFESIERHYCIVEENCLDKFSETDQNSIRHWMDGGGAQRFL